MGLLEDRAVRQGDLPTAQANYRRSNRLNPRHPGDRQAHRRPAQCGSARRWLGFIAVYRLLPWLCARALSFVLAVPAPAQDPQVDPDSSAGPEYHLPTDRPREEASNGSASRGKSGGAAVFISDVADKSRPRTGCPLRTAMPRRPARSRSISPATPETVRAQALAPTGADRRNRCGDAADRRAGWAGMAAADYARLMP